MYFITRQCGWRDARARIGMVRWHQNAYKDANLSLPPILVHSAAYAWANGLYTNAKAAQYGNAMVSDSRAFSNGECILHKQSEGRWQIGCHGRPRY